MHWSIITLIIIGSLLVCVVIYDLLQKQHAILRNFPVLGHLRYIFEAIGPELRQYIVTNNDEERPFLDAVAPDEQVREIDLIYNATMTGPAYQTDSGEVFGILDALTIGEDAANWIEPKTRRTRDGRQAMLDLKHHFDGDDEKYKRLEKAKNMMENLHYKNEQYMSWHIFSTRMN